jgi:hypothetical protein
MITMNTGTMPRNLTVNTKFDSITFSKSGLFLKYRNEPEIEIPFADLDQIYIKRHKLNPFLEFIGILFPFLFVFMAIQYLPFYLMILVSIISIIPVFIIIVNYKWYRFYVRLKDGTTFRKKIASNMKTETFSIVAKIRAEYLHYTATATEPA